jgi:hypothetical protein
MGGLVDNVSKVIKGIPQKLSGGGVAQENIFSGKLHTINININNQPHQVYGDESVINKLERNLRRYQMVTT